MTRDGTMRTGNRHTHLTEDERAEAQRERRRKTENESRELKVNTKG